MSVERLLRVLSDRGLSVRLNAAGTPVLRGPVAEHTSTLADTVKLYRADLLEHLRLHPPPADEKPVEPAVIEAAVGPLAHVKAVAAQADADADGLLAEAARAAKGVGGPPPAAATLFSDAAAVHLQARDTPPADAARQFNDLARAAAATADDCRYVIDTHVGSAIDTALAVAQARREDAARVARDKVRRAAALADAGVFLDSLRAADFTLAAEKVEHEVVFQTVAATHPQTIRRRLHLRWELSVTPADRLRPSQARRVRELTPLLLQLVRGEVMCLGCGVNAPYPGQDCCRGCEPDGDWRPADRFAPLGAGVSGLFASAVDV